MISLESAGYKISIYLSKCDNLAYKMKSANQLFIIWDFGLLGGGGDEGMSSVKPKKSHLLKQQTPNKHGVQN